MISLERVYGKRARPEGFRILVDRVWPRGLSREGLAADLWLKEIAPSPALRKWFGHDPQRWPEFKLRYFAELDGKPDLVRLIAEKARQGPVVLLYGAREERFNNAAALKEYLEGRAG